MHRTLTIFASSLTLTAAFTASPAAASGIPPEAIFSVRDTDNDGRGDMLGGSLTLATRGGFEQSVMAEFRNPYHHDGRVQEAVVWFTIRGEPGVAYTGEIELSAYPADGTVSIADYHVAAIHQTTEPIPTYPGYWQSYAIDLTAVFQDAQARNEEMVGVRIRMMSETPATASVIDAHAWFTYEGQLFCPTCTGDYDQSGGVDGDDIGAFFNDWQMGEPCSDVDGSGGVDGDDIEFFFDRWGGGCC